MKVALLIHAHKMAEQVARLCGVMLHPDIDIYLNIDGKSDITPFREQISAVRFVEPRTDIWWGEFSQVEAGSDSSAEIIVVGLKKTLLRLSNYEILKV